MVLHCGHHLWVQPFVSLRGLSLAPRRPAGSPHHLYERPSAGGLGSPLLILAQAEIKVGGKPKLSYRGSEAESGEFSLTAWVS
jgi:hypothetical protein